jgi:hypothetical protein
MMATNRRPLGRKIDIATMPNGVNRGLSAEGACATRLRRSRPAVFPGKSAWDASARSRRLLVEAGTTQTGRCVPAPRALNTFARPRHAPLAVQRGYQPIQAKYVSRAVAFPGDVAS